MKTNAIIRIVLFSLAILILGTILLGMSAFHFLPYESHSVKTNEEIIPSDASQVNYAGKASDIRDLEIDWAAGSITIVPNSSSDQIVISESVVSNEKYAMHIDQSGNKLKIEFYEEDRNFIGFGNHDIEAKDLTISVPADWVCNSLEIDAASADLKASNMTIREMEFDGASGICTLENCVVDTFEIDTASGDVNFSGTLRTLSFEAASANCNLNVSNVPDSIRLNSMSGDLNITLPENSGFALDMDTMSGNFSSDFDTDLRNGSHIYGDASCHISVNAMSGDVAIRKHHHVHDDNCYSQNSTCPDYGTVHHEDTHH